MSTRIARPWGITPTKVASRINSFQLSATSNPSESDIEAIIKEKASWVAARLRRVGVDPDLDPEGETIGIAESVVYGLVIGEVDTLRGRRNTEMMMTLESAKEMIDAIDVGPQGLGDDAAASKNHRVKTSRSAEKRVKRYNRDNAPLAVRLATRGKT